MAQFSFVTKFNFLSSLLFKYFHASKQIQAFKKGARIPQYQSSLLNFKTLAKNFHILERVKCLQEENNDVSKNKIIAKLSKEISTSWKQQDVPTQSHQAVVTKIKPLINKKKGFTILKLLILNLIISSFLETINLSSVFDILPSKPVWKLQEDLKYYKSQLSGIGKM